MPRKETSSNATESPAIAECTNSKQLDSDVEEAIFDEKEEGKTASSENNEGSIKPVQDAITILGLPPKAIIALNAVAVIWGTQHAVIKMVADDSSAGPFTFLRFSIGAVISSIPLMFNYDPNSNRESKSRNIFPGSDLSNKENDNIKLDNLKLVGRWGVEMGFWLFLGFAFHTIGVAITTAQRSGFLLYLNVKFVPFFAFLLMRRQINISTWISAVTAFSGTALLAYDGESWTIKRGDLWCIAAAAASAMYILRLDAASNAVGDDNTIKLNACCLWVVTLLSGLWSATTVTEDNSFLQEMFDIAMSHPMELIYLSAVTTALANFIQTKAQKDVSAERASVIYAMDPVYGAIFANLLLGETLTSFGYVGAGLITIAAATNAFYDLGKEDTTKRTRKGQ